MQNDPISRSAALEAINEVDISDCTDVDDIIDKAYAEVASIPTIDAVPVVRCKECKHYDAGCWCAELEKGTAEDYFCAYGARMDEEGNK